MKKIEVVELKIENEITETNQITVELPRGGEIIYVEGKFCPLVHVICEAGESNPLEERYFLLIKERAKFKNENLSFIGAFQMFISKDYWYLFEKL